jgi:Tol biopolymer transport system component
MRSLLHALVLCSLSATLLAQTPAPAKWDVTAPFGPTTSVSFETSEGTWMSVDVSPDGRTLVFDLLGDIYTMPIAGGAATRVLSGPAFEMQPRFSPDGRRIAFASDRGGLWNIWTAGVDGSNPKQISTEARWHVNSPTWSPDGPMIYARRHFVGTRSAGAGEVWMYHASGAAGAGVQVTRRANDQKDAGEPAISPDGQYLYYSKDVTPGSTFEYNKDPHGVIFAILRRNLETGEESRLVTRPGGSIAPRPSPDGRYLAFIRRVDLGSELFLKDLGTGEEFSIFDRLDKDLQEAWTIHGVYAQYAWTPDSRRIVIWGEGKLWNVDVAAKQGTEIPFTAQVDQMITPAVRFRVPVFEERFDVKMLRDAQVSPDGRQVAFSALGGLYLRPLPDGEPRPLAPNGYLNNEGDLVQDGVWNNATRSLAEGGSWRLDPAWSPNGEQIVYTAWDDRELGRVFTIDVRSGRAREIVADPGHYIEPSFSPDGRWIAYRKTTGDGTRTSAGSMEPGLYIVPADGSSAPRLVREGGSEPQFDHTGERLYFREQREQFVLASVDLEGNDERVHLQSPNATDIVPSPDGRWVAFSERWHLHVMPFPQTGRPVEIGPASRGMPVAQMSRDAGFFVHWSGDSQRVHWMLGPELFTRDLSRTFGFLTEGAAPGAEPEAAGRHIGFTAESARPSGVKALSGARIITMAPAAGAPQVIENGTILVDGNRDNGDVRRSAADVHDHIAVRFGDRKPGADGCRHCFFD